MSPSSGARLVASSSDSLFTSSIIFLGLQRWQGNSGGEEEEGGGRAEDEREDGEVQERKKMSRMWEKGRIQNSIILCPYPNSY